MTADTILYACNTVAVGLFGIVLSAAFCNIRWTRRNVCCMIASTLAIFLIQGIVYLGIDPALGPYLYPLHTHLPLAITLCLLSHERLWPVISVLTAYLCCQLRRWLALVCVWAFSGGDQMQYAPGYSVKVADTTGAGDTFMGAVCGGADRDAAAAAPAAADGTGSAVYFPLFGDRPVPVRLYTGLVLRL